MVHVEIVSYTPNPECTVAVAARTCFEDTDFKEIEENLSDSDIKRILATVISKGHHSVLEHASFTFAISGVSRVLTHQLVRHRMASYSQLSQQRSDASSIDFVTPPYIRTDPQFTKRYAALMKDCQALYQEMVIHNIPMGSARYVLPSAFTSRITVTMNGRSLFNLLAQRECAAEEWEFRQVATLMHRELMRVAPGIFGFAGVPCETLGVCPEGDVGLTCSRREANEAPVANTRTQIRSLVAAATRS